MKRKVNISFATVFHLAESYQEEYKRRNLLLSPIENEVFFKDYVQQYIDGNKHPVINTDIPLF